MNTFHTKIADWSFPVLGVGTAAWQPPFPPISQGQVNETVRYALENGAALFDTSPLYGLGICETWLGQALEGTPRSRYILSTKAGYKIPADGNSDEHRWPETEWTRDNILRSVETSLARLKTDYLDIVHLHDPDCCPTEALEIAQRVLVELREQKVIGAVGAGMNQAEMLMDFARQGVFDCFLLAGRYTLLEQGALPLLDLCQEKGIGMLLGGVYNTGILATGARPGALYNYRPAGTAILDRVAKIEAVCAQHGISLRSAALQFPLAHPAVRTLVIGMQSPAQVSEAVEAIQVSIPAEFWSNLRTAGLISSDAPVPSTDHE